MANFSIHAARGIIVACLFRFVVRMLKRISFVAFVREEVLRRRPPFLSIASYAALARDC